MQFTVAQIHALAPDAASVKAAQGLTALNKWHGLGQNEQAAWGLCQGSGSKPYQTQIDFSEPAFKCSCPSRKFPCKHGLALLLIRAGNNAALPVDTAPQWVQEWLTSRQAKAQKKEQKASAPEVAAPVDPEAASKRQEKRWLRIEQAAQEVHTWLADLMTTGLATVQNTPLTGWETMAARMVDAQAPGLGMRIERAAELLKNKANPIELVLEDLGLLQLLCDAVANRNHLSAELQAELRQVLGWPFDKQEVLASNAVVSDTWFVIGQIISENGKLNERRVWLESASHGRRVCLQDHSYANQGFGNFWHVNTCVKADVVFYPGTAQLRVLYNQTGSPEAISPIEALPTTTLAQELLQIAQRAGAAPWCLLHPIRLCHCVVSQSTGDVAIVHCEGRQFELTLTSEQLWAVLAVTGGQAVHIMGEWNGHTVRPLLIWNAVQNHATPVWQWDSNGV